MQLRLPLTDAVVPATEAVVFVRHRRARRYILRVLTDGTVRVTLPRWGVRRDAQAFVEASREWIAGQRTRLRARRAAAGSGPVPWSHGTRILIDGHETVLHVQPAARGVRILCGDACVAERPGPERDLRPLVQAWLRDRARRELPPQLLALAARHGITVPRVSVRDQRSRWGACSPTGTITLNWRLVQAPPGVREYVLLHELMHRRELNHSRRFWKLVVACCPGHAEARRWLRKEGKSLWSDSE